MQLAALPGHVLIHKKIRPTCPSKVSVLCWATSHFLSYKNSWGGFLKWQAVCYFSGKKYISVYYFPTFYIRVYLNCKRLVQNFSLVPSDQQIAKKSGGHTKAMSWRRTQTINLTYMLSKYNVSYKESHLRWPLLFKHKTITAGIFILKLTVLC